MARTWPIYLYVPNLMGYARILANLVAFLFAFTNKKIFVCLHVMSFLCDWLDGTFARLLNQTSTFGGVLDMVTDRLSIGVLMVVLSHMYKRYFGLFLGLLALDFASHWFQMHSTSLASKTSHKDVADSKSKLVKAYYEHKMFMCYCCLGAEALYLLLYVTAPEEDSGSLMNVVQNVVMRSSVWAFLTMASLTGWAMKQLVNLVQLRSAADACVLYDMIQKSKTH